MYRAHGLTNLQSLFAKGGARKHKRDDEDDEPMEAKKFRLDGKVFQMPMHYKPVNEEVRAEKDEKIDPALPTFSMPMHVKGKVTNDEI